MSAADIAADVLAGLQEAGAETGNGRPATGFIIRAREPTGPAHNPQPGVPTQHPCTVVYSQWDARLIDGTFIQSDDQRILVGVPDLAITPQVGDLFWNGVALSGTKKIVPPLTQVAPGGAAVLYVLNVRG